MMMNVRNFGRAITSIERVTRVVFVLVPGENVPNVCDVCVERRRTLRISTHNTHTCANRLTECCNDGEPVNLYCDEMSAISIACFLVDNENVCHSVAMTKPTLALTKLLHEYINSMSMKNRVVWIGLNYVYI